jgi:hypothetical protein
LTDDLVPGVETGVELVSSSIFAARAVASRGI